MVQGTIQSCNNSEDRNNFSGMKTANGWPLLVTELQEFSQRYEVDGVLGFGPCSFFGDAPKCVVPLSQG